MMNRYLVGWLITVAVIAALPAAAFAQQAFVSGAITDATGGVMPGVTVTAVHEATGNTFVTVTDAQGGFRLPVRTGPHQLTIELAGFTTVTRALDLLVGQTVPLNLQMSPATVQETVTVTGEAPLIDTSSSALGSNIDPRQMQELPLNGRNWVDLTVLAAGSRVNAVNEVPTNANVSVTFQLNLDGQQVSQTIAPSFGQPRFSRDAIAEFEFVSSRFSATEGRSSGVQVNAITKSGTNTLGGTFSGYFRDDKFNAADHVAGRVLPYSDKQLSGTFGGPFIRDRFHYFVSYEDEREPQTFVYTTPFPQFNTSLTGTREEKKGLVRLDYQFTPQTRLSMRANRYTNSLPYSPTETGGANRTAASAIGLDRRSDQVLLSFTHVIRNRMLNEIRAGHDYFLFYQYAHIRNPNSLPGQVPGFGAPRIIFQGFTLGQNHDRTPQGLGQDVWSVRENFSATFAAAGRHDLKIGGEYLHHFFFENGCALCVGTLDMQGGPLPANLPDYFPDPTDISTWNLAPLSPLARSYLRSIATTSSTASRPSGNNGFTVYAPYHMVASWIQDDWAVSPRLTVNLGLRYDLFMDNYANWVGIAPILPPDRPNDTNDLGPRLGFAYSLSDKTVVRGGWGKYFSQQADIPLLNTIRKAQQIVPQVLNDGRPDFAVNPFNGPAPTYDEAWARTCLRSPGLAGCLRPSLDLIAMPDLETGYSYQSSMGVQRQLGPVMSVEADYVYIAERSGLAANKEMNLTYNPASGANHPFTDISRRVYPEFTSLTPYRSDARSNYHALQMAMTKRLSNRWQASATYTLAGQWDFDVVPLWPGCEYPMTINPSGQRVCDVPITLAPDVSEKDWYLSGHQRHRATLNGIWDVGYGIQLSGIYLFGDNGKDTPTSALDLRQVGRVQTGGAFGGRLRADGTIIERNSFDRSTIHRVDLRVQRRFRIGSRFAVDGILEVFNAFNHANFNAFVLNERLSNFRRPVQDTNVAYAPRMVQLGFRATF